MKENSGSINQVLFSQFFSSVLDDGYESHLRRMRRRIHSWIKETIPSAIATCVMGVVFFVCITLFLYQLAEFGW
ncbi:MAG: hypothetical protein OEL83_01520 [Desulforhopalus sp.]|nr:hypothetical protein [Desulforhopalus sp.]